MVVLQQMEGLRRFDQGEKRDLCQVHAMDTAKDQVEQVDRLTSLMTDSNSAGKGLIKVRRAIDWKD